jgi:predicted dehydrogenase
MSEKRFKALVLSVVKHAYIALAVDAHPRFDLVAVCDDPHEPDWVHDRNQEFADRFDLPYVRDLDQAVQDYSPDIAVVSSQAERHCDLAVRASSAGLHVIVDKPLSTRLSECDRLVESVESTGVRCLVWNRNFLPSVRQAHQAVQDGAIGALRAIHCDFYFSKDAGPPKGTRRTGDQPLDWQQRQIEAHADGSDGGVGREPMGELQIEGIYPLAYIRLLSGRKVKRVFTRTAAHFHQANVDNHVDDLATVTLDMEGGVVGSLCIGRIGAASHPDIGEIKLHLLGTEGSLVVSESRPEIALYYRDQPPKEFRHIRVADENNYLLMDDFARAIEEETPTMLDALGGREICATVEACLRSAKSGRLESVI